MPAIRHIERMYIVGHHDDVVLYLHIGVPVYPVCPRGRYEELIRSETDAIIASSSHQPGTHGTSFLAFRILRSPPTPSLAHNVVMTYALIANV